VHNLAQRNYRRILIIKPSSFGDVLHALPVLNGLRTRFPHAKISWLVSTACAGLLEGHPALDDIILFDRKRFGRIGRNLRVTMEFLEFIQSLRRKQFDLVIDLQGLFRSGFFAWISGASVRIGFASAREFAWLFYNHRLRPEHPDIHAVHQNYLAGQILGFDNLPIRFDIHVQQAAREEARVILEQNGIQPNESFVLLAPTTRWETKIWPAEYFAAVGRWIQEQYQLPVVVTGGPDEKDITSNVAKQIGGLAVDVAGKINIPQLTALVESARLIITNDSGPMHLAAALNTPLIAIYGPTNPQRTGPFGHEQAVLRLNLPCSPCYIRKTAQCPYQHRCMKDLTPEMVIEKVNELLSNGVPSCAPTHG